MSKHKLKITAESKLSYHCMLDLLESSEQIARHDSFFVRDGHCVGCGERFSIIGIRHQMLCPWKKFSDAIDLLHAIEMDIYPRELDFKD